MRRYLAVALFLLLVCALPGQAQYTSYALIGSDGNLYGSSGPDFYSYSPTSGAMTTLNSVGLVLCAERSDGTLLGYNYSSNNTLQLVKASLTGQITPIVAFPETSFPTCPVLAVDGNYYGAADSGGDYGYGYLYQLTAAGALNVFYSFTGMGDGRGPSTPPVEGSDGNLYFFGSASLLRYSPTTGVSVTPLSYTLLGPPQEGPNGDFFGLDAAQTSIVRVSPAGAANAVYTVASNSGTTLSNLAVLENELAVVSESGYTNYDNGDGCTGYGNYLTLLTLSPTGVLGNSFDLIGTNEANNGYNADADSYSYSILLGTNGTFYGVYADDNQIDNVTYVNDHAECAEISTTSGPYKIQAASTYPSIQMSLSKTHVLPAGTATLTWNVENAYSSTLQQCFGFGGLSGKVALSGSTTLTAAKAGSFVTSIVCGGTETGFVTLNSEATNLVLVPSPTEVAIGSEATLTATVTNTGNPAPSGNVKFFYGSTLIGTAPLVDGVATLTISTTGLPAGIYNITSSYAGDGNYSSATSRSISITLVAKQPTTMSASPTSQTSLQGATATIYAFVAGSSPLGIPTGSLTFSYGSTVLLTTPLGAYNSTTSVARFSVSTTGIPAGTYPITLTYGGDANNLGSSATSTVIIQATTVVTLTATPNPSPATSSFTLTATPKGEDTPTGTVVFYNGAAQLASTNLNGSGVATVTLPAGTLAAGSYSLTAYYAGDKNNPPGTSSVVSFTVQ